MSVRGFYVYVCMHDCIVRRASIYLLLAKDGESYPLEDDEDAPLEAALHDVEVHF
jgi:hypothetical protein